MDQRRLLVLPGFDKLRILGAVSVLLTHAYLITQNSEGSEPLQLHLGGEKNIAGLYGVFLCQQGAAYLPPNEWVPSAVTTTSTCRNIHHSETDLSRNASGQH